MDAIEHKKDSTGNMSGKVTLDTVEGNLSPCKG